MDGIYHIKTGITDAVKTGRMEAFVQNIDANVPLDFMQNRMAMHETIATGSLEDGGKEIRFEVFHSFDRVYVRFQNMKGSLPGIGLNIKDLVQSAFDAAKANVLFK